MPVTLSLLTLCCASACREEPTAPETPSPPLEAPAPAPAATEPRAPSSLRFIAIIDSGVDASHELLASAFAPADEVRASLPEELQPAAVDQFVGWDLVSNGPLQEDRTGHGSHIAGILARELKTEGTPPPYRLIAIRTGDRSHEPALLTRAVTMLVDLKKRGFRIPVLVMPMEFYPLPEHAEELAHLEEALTALLDTHTLLVCAAGNKGRNNDEAGDSSHCYPSDFDLPDLLSVACCTDAGQLHPLSNYGAQSVDLAAPGFGIESAGPDGGLRKESGTSQSSALVAARAAKLWEADPTQSAAAIKTALLKQVHIQPSLLGKCVTNGYLPPE